MVQSQNPPHRQVSSKMDRPMIQAVSTGTIISDLNFDEKLIGAAPALRRDNPYLHDGLATISAFLRKHQYLSSEHLNDSDSGLARIYKQTMDEFLKSQMDRQAMGLRTNTLGASSEGMKRVIECHSDALQYALDSHFSISETIQEEQLCNIHSKLCPGIPESGNFRQNRVRASNTSFVSPTNIRNEMAQFSGAVSRFQTELATYSTDVAGDKQLHKSVYQKIAIAAIILFGINDIHPFQDGNGRTARMLMNVVLRKILGLPFPITITATPPHRQEYINELRACRMRFQTLSTKPKRIQHRSSSSDKIGNPIFQNLTVVVLNGVLHAVRQAQSQLESKTKAAAIEEEDKIARRVRERAATGQCIICLDENPDVATLCCGQVVHMGCLAEWLSNQGSCIACRKPMRRLVRRQQQNHGSSQINAAATAAHNDNDVAIAAALQNENNELEEATTSGLDSEESFGDSIYSYDSENSPTMEDTTGTTSLQSTNDSDLSTTEDTTSDYSDGDPNVAAEGATGNERTEGTTTDTSDEDGATDDTTTSEDTVSQSQGSSTSPFCWRCERNRFAVDCVNQLCGRCCQLNGFINCPRHNT